MIYVYTNICIYIYIIYSSYKMTRLLSETTLLWNHKASPGFTPPFANLLAFFAPWRKGIQHALDVHRTYLMQHQYGNTIYSITII